MRGSRPLRIANISGFYGDRMAAPTELLASAEVDVLTGDYLAELTMFLLHKARLRDPEAGFATTFLKQAENFLTDVVARDIKVVVNAGGLNPRGLARRLQELASRQGLELRVATVDGDDLVARMPELRAAGEPFRNLDTGEVLDPHRTLVTANAYLGAWGIVEALEAGAQIVVTGRVTDASLVVGPAAWWFGWSRDDHDALAGAVAAGHVIECGPQATGGNYSYFDELESAVHPGFPIAEVELDGSTVITKPEGSAGQVTVDTVTAQLLYEVAGSAYLGPDVVTHLDTVQLSTDGPDRVRISGTRGSPPNGRLKVAVCADGGFRNAMTLVLTGLDIEAKAAHAEAMLLHMLGGKEVFETFSSQLLRFDREDASTQAQASAHLVISVTDRDRSKVGRAFSSAVVELYLAGYPGFYTTTPPGDATNIGVYWPTLVDAGHVRTRVCTTWDDRQWDVDWSVAGEASSPAAPGRVLPPPVSPTEDRPLGTVAAARSGDKGGNANVGLWTRDDASHAWLSGFLDVERFQTLFPETSGLKVQRHDLPNLRAVNFVVRGLLGSGVASSTRMDPQAKAFAEFVRSRVVPVPVTLLAD